VKLPDIPAIKELKSFLKKSTDELIDIESQGETCETLEVLKVLLAVNIINLRDKKPATNKAVAKMTARFPLRELLSQTEFLDKRFSNGEKVRIIHQIEESGRRGATINPAHFYE